VRVRTQLQETVHTHKFTAHRHIMRMRFCMRRILVISKNVLTRTTKN